MASGTYAKSIVRKWYKEFPKSDLFQALNPTFQKNAKWTVEFFAEMMADYMDDPPLAWNGEDAAYLVVHLIPSKSIFEKEIFAGFCPILRAFFEFLGRNIIEEKWSKELVKSLTGKDHELLKNAKSVILTEESEIDENENTLNSELKLPIVRLILSQVLSKQHYPHSSADIDNLILKLSHINDWTCNDCHQPINIGDGFMIGQKGVIHYNEKCANQIGFQEGFFHFIRQAPNPDKNVK